MTKALIASLAGVAACIGVGIVIGACSEREGSGFTGPTGGFEQDASTDAPECPLQCSIDGRSVVRSCTGAIVETCPGELACGAGRCQEQCAAAAADRSSNGCAFYFQPPLFTKSFGRSCYAAYVVNTSTSPVDMKLEYQGKVLDITKSVFQTKPGDATLIPHAGPIAVGESAILFVYDRDPSTPGNSGAGGDTPCPEGVVPATIVDGLPDGTGFGSSFHLETTAPVNLSAIYPYGGAPGWSPSATLLLPVGTWGKQHILVNAWERIAVQISAGAGWPAAHIVASEDDTEITIDPTRTIQDGANVVGTAARMPVTYRLAKGQVLQLDQAEELSGSIVTSTKPTSIFGGNECMYVPATRTACDTAQQQLPALEQWGSEYVGVGYRPRLGDEHEPMPYRIVAARDGTRLDYDPAVPPGAPITLSAGEIVTFWSGTGDAFVVRTQDADHPIYLAAYMSGAGAPLVGEDFLGNRQFLGNGDPEFVNVIPSGQYLNSYTFFADPTYDETSLVVVRAASKDRFNDVWLECAGNLTGFKPVGTRGKYEYVRVDLSRQGGPGQSFVSGVCQKGLQRMRSDGPFTATLWGWSQWASYAYPGGMAQRRLMQTPLPPIR